MNNNTGYTAPPPGLRQVEYAERDVAEAYRMLRHRGLTNAAVDECHMFYQGQRVSRDDLAGRLALAQAAQRALDGFFQLDRPRIEVLQRRQLFYSAKTEAEARAVYDSVPALAEYRAALDAKRAEIAERQATADANRRAAEERDAPRAIVCRLRAAGVKLTLDDDGKITAPASAVISADDREQVARYRDRIVEHLQAEAAAAAEANRPVVIA